MSRPERLERLEVLFNACLELPDAERSAYLERECGGDRALIANVLDLLVRDARSAQATSPLFSNSDAEPPKVIGPYRLRKKLGEGGFGSVWEAEQTSPVRRSVAIKILKAGMDSRAILARFEAERQALALMDHPDIARVFDAGETESGRSYFVMELVAGESITADCEQHQRSLEERLRLFVDVCRAVEHAHQKGVIHRDLKPSNILVTSADGRARPKVIDFGIAKATAPHLIGEDLLTRTGEFLGTPEYMSPEQALSGGIDVDTRSDVYSLGVVLYRLLTERLPFESERLRQNGPAEMLRIIREEDPPRPSEIVQLMRKPKADASRATASGARELRGDLDWIVLHAIEKDRRQRYASPAALADDIERHLRNEPILARPPSTAYRLRKLVRRNRVLVIGVAAVAVALILGLAATSFQAWRATRAEEQSRRQAEIASAVNNFLTGMLAAADPRHNPRGREVTLLETVDRAADELSRESKLNPEVEAAVRHTLAETYVGLSQLDRAAGHIQRCVELRTSLLGPDSEVTLESQITRAEIASLQGRWDEAESTLSIVSTSLSKLADVSDDILASYSQIRGSIFIQRQRLDEADSLLSRAVEIRRRQPASEASELISSLNDLSTLRKVRNQLDGALPLVREALELARRAHPEDHHDVAIAAGHTAGILRRMGHYAEAESLIRESIAIDRRILGSDHDVLGQSLGNLAQLLDERGRFAEAESLYRECIDIFDRSLGAEHPLSMTALNNLATTIQNQGRLDEALRIRLKVLQVRRRIWGNDHEEVAVSLNNVGSLYRLMKRFPEALHAFEEAKEVFVRVHGSEHPNSVIAVNNIGKTHLDAGNYADAEKQLQLAVDLCRRAFPEDHPSTAAALSNHGQALARLGRREAAESELVTAYERLAAAFGASHPRTRETAKALADLYSDWGRAADRVRWEKVARAEGS